MKDSEVITLARVAEALEEYLPVKEYELYNDYLSLYEHLREKREKQSQYYQSKAEYHREATRQWRQDNKEKHYAYQKEYSAKKRAASKQN